MQQQIGSRSIALTVLGAVIGAGFASGQEINHFFVRFGAAGAWGVATSAIGFLFLMIWLSRLCLAGGIAGFPGLLAVLGGGRAASAFRHIFAAFLLIGLIVMMAGSASLLQEVFGVSKLFFGLLTVLLVYLVSGRRSEGLTTANDLLMPCLLFLFLFFLLRSLSAAGVPAIVVATTARGAWFWSGLLYTAMNSAILLVVIPPLVTQTASPRDAYRGVIGAIGLLSALLLLVVYLISKYQGVIAGQEMPLLAVCRHLLPSLPWLYAIPLWIALVTTAFADAMGIRVYLEEHLPGRANQLFILLLAIAAVSSQLSFASLVTLLYPLIGYVCLGFYLFCFLRWILRSLTA